MGFSEKERQAFELINKGQKDEAAQLLFELIVDCAENNDFVKADSLRQTLVKESPMALTEIISSGEILEEKKYNKIDPIHKNTWKALYKEFSIEEANEFYYSLKTINIKPDRIIIQQRKLNDKLFFINRGILKIICKSKTNEVFLKESSRGEICGFSSFFFISMATTSVIAGNRVNVSYISRKAFSNITENLSGFDSKLQELCSKLVKTNSTDIIKAKNLERRGHRRIPTVGKVAACLLGTDGKKCEELFNGVLNDLSIGGARFTIKTSAKENARSLLGRKAKIKLMSNDNGNSLMETKKGWIIGLDDHLFNDYSISFRFHTPLSRQFLFQFTRT